MKRSTRFLVSALVGTSTLLTAVPAYAQYDSSGGDAALGIGFLVCWGVVALFGLALFALNIWMLIDSISRQEYEYPSGTTKTTWMILLVVGIVVGFGWIVALVYYFMVFKKVKRGSVAPPWAQQQSAPIGAPRPPAAPQPPASPPVQSQPPAPPAPATAPAPPTPPPAAPAPPAPPAPPAAPPETPGDMGTPGQ